jgi:hypothetical protein
MESIEEVALFRRFAVMLWILISLVPAWSGEVSLKSVAGVGKVAMSMQVQLSSNTFKNSRYELKSVEPLLEQGDVVAYALQFNPDAFLIMAPRDEMAPVQFSCVGISFSTVKNDPFIQDLLHRMKDICHVIRLAETDSSMSRAVTNSKDVFSSTLGKHDSVKDRLLLDPCSTSDNKVAWKQLENGSGGKNGLVDQVEPLLKTTWNQGVPYNMLTPEINGHHTWVGCVATAMAQVMKYWEWPLRGQGSNSYSWYPNGAGSQVLSGDFEHDFLWDVMLDNYSSDGTETQEQKEAVAQLMLDSGLAVNMNYGLDASGAGTPHMRDAMVQYFKYDSHAKMVMEWTTFGAAKKTWFWVIAKELRMGCPVLLAISGLDSSSGTLVGHLVVADGYRVDELGNQVHLNLGWGGSSNAYYTIDGIVAGYDFTLWKNQEVALNMYPDGREGAWLHINTTPSPVLGDIYLDGEMVGNGAWFQSVEPGEHQVSFGSVDGYQAPKPVEVTVSDQHTAFVTGEYLPDEVRLYALNGAHGHSNYCGEYEFGIDSEIQVEAFPDKGYAFTHWSGTITSDQNPMIISIEEDTTLQANYEPIQTVELKVNTEGSGSVQLSPNSSVVNKGDTVQAKAMPEDGWVFDHWTGDLQEDLTKDFDINLDMESSRVLTAHFRKLSDVLVPIGTANLASYSRLKISGSMAFCGLKHVGVDIVDLSSPECTVVGHYPTGFGYIGDLETMTNTLLVAVNNGTDNSYIHVVDISHPASPVLLTKIHPYMQGLSTSIDDLLLSGNTLFVSGGRSGLWIYDLSIPAKPVLLGRYMIKISGDLYLKENTLYVLDRLSGLVALDISDPTFPIFLGSIQVPEFSPQWAKFLNGRAYVVGDTPDNDSRMVEIEIENPSEMHMVDYVSVACSPLRIFSTDDYVHVRNYCNELLSLKPQPSGGLSLVATRHLKVQDMCQADNTVYGVGTGGLFRIDDVEHSESGTHVCFPDRPAFGWVSGVAVSGDSAYVMVPDEGIKVLDISDSTASVLKNEFGRSPGVLRCDNGYLYEAIPEQFTIYSLEDPMNPVTLSAVTHTWTASNNLPVDIKFDSGYAYVAAYEAGVYVFDVSDPLNVEMESEIGGIGLATGLAVNGDYLAVASSSGLVILDVKDKQNPHVVSIVKGEDPCSDVAWKSSVAYTVGGYKHAASIYDLSDVSSPSFVKGLPYDRYGYLGSDVSVDENKLIISLNGVLVYDISNPLEPNLLASTYERSRYHVLQDNRIYGIDDIGGRLLTYALVPDGRKLVIPHIASSDGWHTHLVVDNYGNEGESIGVSLVNQGTAISGKSFVVQPGEMQHTELTDGSCGSVVAPNSKTVIKESFQNENEGGMAEFMLSENQSNELTFLFPHYLASEMTWMGLAVDNDGNEDAQITGKAYDTDGIVIGTATFVVQPQSRFVGMVSQLFDGLDFRMLSRVELNSERPISGLNISGHDNAQLLFMPAIGDRDEKTTLYIPHIANEVATWNNFLVFDNTGDDMESAEICFYDGAGGSLTRVVDVAPESSSCLPLDDVAGSGYMTGKTDISSANLLVRQSFQSKQYKGTAEFLLSGNSSSKLVFSFPTYATDLLDWMGLAVCNVENGPNEVVLKAYSGAEMVEEKTIQLAPHERSAFVVSDLFTTTGAKGFDRIEAQGTGGLTGVTISGAGLERLLFTPATDAM